MGLWGNAGEYFVTAIDPRLLRYPRLHSEEAVARLERAQAIVVSVVKDIAENTLPELGFDAKAIEVYRNAALKAFAMLFL